ncbi:MAG TPA: 50S ribosomal protein L2 [Candidatus Nanoarchaeia archaeon]|nr:50S ribosomal protein L2 [Candidatus Nanoarchaeia archaeon]
MGKNLISQRRGKGTPRYRSPSFNFVGAATHRKLDKETVSGIIVDLVDCPGHSAPLAAVRYSNGERTFIIAPEGVKVGDTLSSGVEATIAIGNTIPLKNIPDGTLVYNVENSPGDGGKLIRSSGTFGKVIARTEHTVKVLMPSTKEKEFNHDCRAQVGVVAGSGRTEKPFLKAGARHYARKARNKMYPRVCGVSMNAVDHPYGGKSSHHKGKVTIAPKYAPAGRKVGKIRPRRTGMKR